MSGFAPLCCAAANARDVPGRGKGTLEPVTRHGRAVRSPSLPSESSSSDRASGHWPNASAMRTYRHFRNGFDASALQSVSPLGVAA